MTVEGLVFRSSSEGVQSFSIVSVMDNAVLTFKFDVNKRAEQEVTQNGFYSLAFANGETKQIDVKDILASSPIEEVSEITLPDLKVGDEIFTFV